MKLAPSLHAIAVLAIGVTVGASTSASDDKQVCVRAVEHAQVVRLDGKLREAREGFVTCARAVCPEAIRQDCTRWVADVDASMPTVVVDAVWSDGHDVVGLSVVLDGQPLANAAGGRAFALDPGAHTFRFEVPGAAPVETRNVIREGEKNRVLHVTFTPAVPNVVAVPPPPPAPAPATPNIPAAMWHLEPDNVATRRHPIPISAFVVGSIALASFGGFVFAAVSGESQLDHLRSTCAPSCDPSSANGPRREILIGDILGYVALAAAGATTWLVLTRPEVTRTEAAR